MIAGYVKNFSWTDKPEIPKHIAFMAAIAVLALLLAFKLKPYYVNQPKNQFYSETQSSSPSDKRTELEKGNADLSQPNSGQRSFLGHLLEAARPTSTERETSSLERTTRKSYLIERPLFDGLLVTLKAMTTQAISTNQGDSNVEALVMGAGDADTESQVDLSPFKGAKLLGSFSPNFENKRLDLKFTEMITKVGRHYSIQGIAFDMERQVPGVQANYSSGLFSRIAGAALGRAITLGDQLGTARILRNAGNDNLAVAELDRSFSDTTTEASNDVSQEATQGLRSAKAELSLPAGSTFFLKARAADSTGDAS